MFSVPARFTEPKGIYALEAMAAGVPVIQPNHGAFPEMIASSGGGQLFEHLNVEALARVLERYVRDPKLREAHAVAGREWVTRNAGRRAMAESTAEVFSRYL